MSQHDAAPILDHDPSAPSVFLPRNLLDGARRYKNLSERAVPSGCLLDMDGELVERLVEKGRAVLEATWPCFHTRLYRWSVGGADYGVVGGAVGAPLAVLVAEELFASGCEALVSMSSAGLVATHAQPPFFVLIDRALRDEGTSYHYLPPSRYVDTDSALMDVVMLAMADLDTAILRGASWTTDAPFRETAALIASRRTEGIISVEMEAAGLLAMGQALSKQVLCLAHVTNAMATGPSDFEKGGNDGHDVSLELCRRALDAMVARVQGEPLLNDSLAK